MSSLKLFFLGSPQIERDGVPIELESHKGLALLAYLAITGASRRYSRDALSTLLWPDYDQRQARAYLRRALWLLKNALGEEWLEISREYVGLNPAANIWLDVAEFRRQLTATTTHGHPANEVCAGCLACLTAAVELYRGDFLAGFTLPDTPDFDEWQFFQSEGLRRELAGILEWLAYTYSAQGQYEPAISYARRWLRLDPLHEPAHRWLMQLYAWLGQQTAALRQYRECVRLLKAELGTPPEKETTQLYEAIKAKRLSLPPALRQTSAPASTLRPQTQASPPQLPFLDSEAEPIERNQPVFVARERELAELATTLETTCTDQGQILFVIGGAGRGKTTLVQEFARQAQAADPELIMVSGQCNAHIGLGDPYLPFRELLSMVTGELETRWAAGLITPQQAKRLWELRPVSLPALVEHAPDLIESLIPGQALLNRAASFATEEEPWFKQLRALVGEPDRARLEQRRLFSQYTALLKAIAARQPLLLILEDLHWVDTSSSALLFHLSRELRDSRILIIGTYRPDEVALNRGDGLHPLAGIISELKRQHGDIWLDLGELAPMEGRQFVEAYLDTQPNRLGTAFRAALFRRTEGHALFTVELLREMQERGDLRRAKDGYWVEGETINWNTLPAKVEGVIEKCIARLEAPLQTVLTVASVEGETFTAEVVAQVQQLEVRALVQQLSGELDKRQQLITAQGLEWVGQKRLSRYRFRHHLFQHYLYHKLDEMERTYLHEVVGNVLEALYGEQSAQVAVQLARHFEQAGLTQKAVKYLLQAGKRASQLSANEEAITHLSKGLDLLKTLPDSPEHTRQELEFQITLGNALIATEGYAAPKVGQTFSRARDLCQKIGETPQLFSVLHGLHRFYFVRAELQTARELGEQLLRLAQGQQDPLLLVPAQRVMGATLWALGECALARTHLEQGLALYNPQQHHTYVLLYGQDEGVTCLAYATWTLMLLGYVDQALQRCHEALTLAQELAQPYSLAYASNYAAWLHLFRREAWIVQEQTEVAIAIATEQGFAFWLAMAMIYRSLALTEQGQGETGMAQMHQGLAAWRDTGAELSRHFFLGLLAEVHVETDQVKEGLVVVEEALAAVPKTGRYWEAELYRLKGELLLQAEPNAEVEAEKYFWQAIEVAQRQEAKSLELRAVMSLSRLWQKQGKREEARQKLAEIYGWFTEGFDTADLQEAKTLLERLA